MGASHLNGTTGLCSGLDPVTGRLVVHLEGPNGSKEGGLQYKVKLSNVLVIVRQGQGTQGTTLPPEPEGVPPPPASLMGGAAPAASGRGKSPLGAGQGGEGGEEGETPRGGRGPAGVPVVGVIA